MDQKIVFSEKLSKADTLILKNLEADIKDVSSRPPPSNGHAAGKENGHTKTANGSAYHPEDPVSVPSEEEANRDEAALAMMTGMNDPSGTYFEPSVFNTWDLSTLGKLPPVLDRLLKSYVELGKSIVRVETDVVMLTHMILYFTTSVPSALWLFYHFTWVHGVMHTVMQVSYTGAYTLMMHQHIHGRGVLNKSYAWFDLTFPYLLDPLMGHTWNSYFYHHVKHHHVEGNGPDDLSSTIRYQRDSLWHFLQYVGRFYFFVWLELPLYFFRNNRPVFALKAAFWEFSSYALQYTMWKLNWRASIFVFLLPLAIMRLGLMIGNWGQHALVDRDEPDSDYRSSITLLDVPSNRHCFNDGYHTSHHLNPMRHWREHPVAFLKAKHTYASNGALVFHDIDYLFMTVTLLRKDYARLAECMVPIGEKQIRMTMEERAVMLRRHTTAFTEDEIKAKFGNAKTE
ncbi:hypothetical protein INS49_007479 [Diaporthe citri]|uniref:uncharacterized protein n=1 Tax=Diaporthe citri TaxID=83186 RepID=UPI001C7E8F5F|nr:uncharacterized protein INS49_007479 [Diaporthe citri]KAG6353397.1 hypothetical protein INS49_007479 [Diaporthe citri]